MKSNEGAHLSFASWAWPGLVAFGAAGMWLVPANVPLRLTVGLLVLSATLGMVWLYRIRALRRLSAALDAFAERELAPRERPLPTPPRKSKRGLS